MMFWMMRRLGLINSSRELVYFSSLADRFQLDWIDIIYGRKVPSPSFPHVSALGFYLFYNITHPSKFPLLESYKANITLIYWPLRSCYRRYSQPFQDVFTAACLHCVCCSYSPGVFSWVGLCQSID
jgi:hypothetical protein